MYRFLPVCSSARLVSVPADDRSGDTGRWNRRRDVSRNCSNLAGGVRRVLRVSERNWFDRSCSRIYRLAVRCLIADILAKRAEGTHGGLAVWSTGREESADSILTHSLPLSFSLLLHPSSVRLSHPSSPLLFPWSLGYHPVLLRHFPLPSALLRPSSAFSSSSSASSASSASSSSSYREAALPVAE